MRISGKVRLSGVGKIGRPVSVTLAGSMLLVGIGCGTLTPPADKGAAADRKADNTVIILTNLAAVPATGEGSALTILKAVIPALYGTTVGIPGDPAAVPGVASKAKKS